MTNSPESHRSVDPSVAFGVDEAMFAYKMAGPLGSDSTRAMIEAADDAVRTATRMFDRPDIDTELATSALIERLTEGLGAIEEEG